MSYLLKPLKIGNLILKNRLVMPPMVTDKADAYGNVTDEILDFYKDKTDGGYISLLIVENCYISREGKFDKRQLSISDNSTIEGLKKLSDVIHSNGSKCIMQINHAGYKANEKDIGMIPVGPSPIPNYRVRELSLPEIEILIQKYADAASRVKAAGFDGVEIHSAHGFLLNQFYSPIINKRNDIYGGDVYNRIRLHLEIIKRIRSTVGKDFIISLRLGACDYIEGGTTIEDSLFAAVEFEKASVDILSISGGLLGFTIPGISTQGYFAPLSEAIKKVVDLPIILTGGIKEVEYAERLLADNKSDLIGIGRAIFINSSWARMAIESLKA
ncbi:NADH:flavin oxidoreductase [Ruminiclostridium herbifermentans]|uniref:NADH:flavin oxidoreductase n=1 Tax=Ruminiclostridium herbifermentans TaxID=2488810 RepID=A0A4U7JJW2_9FIRM|nr:NADH:flavin oxidoreductase [Ruminiclostridium herbifermentans]QNU68223.1 NADH:flavin oxidoreductase [Ruminiclostridium herbifermentans]